MTLSEYHMLSRTVRRKATSEPAISIRIAPYCRPLVTRSCIQDEILCVLEVGLTAEITSLMRRLNVCRNVSLLLQHHTFFHLRVREGEYRF